MKKVEKQKKGQVYIRIIGRQQEPQGVREERQEDRECYQMSKEIFGSLVPKDLLKHKGRLNKNFCWAELVKDCFLGLRLAVLLRQCQGLVWGNSEVPYNLHLNLSHKCTCFFANTASRQVS